MLIIIAVIGFAILLLIPKNAPNISNALVNEENGDIVFLYYDSKYATTTFWWYDVSGKLILSKTFSGGSEGPVAFCGEDLHISITKSGEYAYNRLGDEITPMSHSELSQIGNYDFKGWTNGYGEKEFYFGNYVYRYEETPYPASLFKSESRIYIKNMESDEIIELKSFK